MNNTHDANTTASVTTSTPARSFDSFGLSKQILAGVEELGFSEATPVQAEAIPYVLQGRDVVASAQTGTGKTAAFALPTLQRIAKQEGGLPARFKQPNTGKRGQSTRAHRGPFALVITPTRELAQQIEKVVSTLCKHTGQKAAIATGGARMDAQIKALQRGCDMLVATPGRLIDLMEQKVVSLKQVQIFVLDEADRMLDMGFWPSVRRIMESLPKKRQTLLFSATIPPSIAATINAMLTNPATVEIARIGQTADTVSEHLCPVVQGQKTQLLLALLAHDNPERMLVFCRTKQRVDEVFAALKRSDVRVGIMHADRPQKARERALESFREGKLQVLVATDVMSRGIDVMGIDSVVNYDVPLDPEDYVHRIGRTGRAGMAGHAYTFVAPDEISPMREIEYFTKSLVPVWDLEGFSYDEGRILPSAHRSTSKPTRSVFSGSRSHGRGFGGPRGGRYGRHT